VPTSDDKPLLCERSACGKLVTMYFYNNVAMLFFALAFMALGYLKSGAGQDGSMVLVFYGNGILQDIDMEINHMKLYCIIIIIIINGAHILIIITDILFHIVEIQFKGSIVK